jgi:hypothetical protein
MFLINHFRNRTAQTNAAQSQDANALGEPCLHSAVWCILPACVFFRQIIHLIHSYIYYKENKMGGTCSRYETDEKCI